MPVRLVLLDVNETLFSLAPVAERFGQVGLEGGFELWFTSILRDGFAAATAAEPVPFVDLARHHLTAMLQRRGLDADSRTVDEVIEGFDEVTAHPDVRDGLHALRDAGLTAVTLTVGSADITRRFLQRERLEELVTRVYDATIAGHWKPSPGAYHHVLDEHGVTPDEAALVAVHPWDVMGGQQAGLVGAWLDRDSDLYPDAFPAPDVTAATLSQVVTALV